MKCNVLSNILQIQLFTNTLRSLKRRKSLIYTAGRPSNYSTILNTKFINYYVDNYKSLLMITFQHMTLSCRYNITK